MRVPPCATGRQRATTCPGTDRLHPTSHTDWRLPPAPPQAVHQAVSRVGFHLRTAYARYSPIRLEKSRRRHGDFDNWPGDCRSRTRPGYFKTRPGDCSSRPGDCYDTRSGFSPAEPKYFPLPNRPGTSRLQIAEQLFDWGGGNQGRAAKEKSTRTKSKKYKEKPIA